MRSREAGTILLEFLLASIPMAAAVGCLMLFLERFLVAREMEHEAAAHAIARLYRAPAPRPILRCASVRASGGRRAALARSKCRRLERGVRLER